MVGSGQGLMVRGFGFKGPARDSKGPSKMVPCSGSGVSRKRRVRDGILSF